MNRIPVVQKDERENYGAPTTEVEKQQKPAAPIYGKPKAEKSAVTKKPATKAKAKK